MHKGGGVKLEQQARAEAKAEGFWSCNSREYYDPEEECRRGKPESPLSSALLSIIAEGRLSLTNRPHVTVRVLQC